MNKTTFEGNHPRWIFRQIQWIRQHFDWLAGILVIASLLPVLYCGMFNYASADDFAKSYTVHNVLLVGGNVLDAIYASVLAAADVWKIWEGTWASNFFLAFQPSIWGEHVYAITVPLCILYTMVGTGYLLKEILVRRMGVSRKAFRCIYWLQLFLFLQFMPYIRGGMFWYTGMAHYVMPMCFSLLMITWMLKWQRTKLHRYYVFMLIDAIYIGGSHYQHIIFVLLVLLTGWLWSIFISQRDQKRMVLLWVPMIEILIGLYICVLSPGNATRGGEGFGLHPVAILLMPLSCVRQAVLHVAEYTKEVPVLVIYAVALIWLGWRQVRWNCGLERTKQTCERLVPAFLCLLYLFLLYASTEAPGIYATGNTAGISGGYYDIVYQSMILVMTIGLPILGAWIRSIQEKVGERKAALQVKNCKESSVRLFFGVLLLTVLGLICLKPCAKQSAAYVCYDFAQSGRLRDFVIQMEERIELLNDDSLTDIYVPEMNDEQGPFMHLQLSQDCTNYTNESTALYYNKNTVTAVPREQYYREYGKSQGHEIPEEYRELYSE